MPQFPPHLTLHSTCAFVMVPGEHDVLRSVEHWTKEKIDDEAGVVVGDCAVGSSSPCARDACKRAVMDSEREQFSSYMALTRAFGAGAPIHHLSMLSKALIAFDGC